LATFSELGQFRYLEICAKTRPPAAMDRIGATIVIIQTRSGIGCHKTFLLALHIRLYGSGERPMNAAYWDDIDRILPFQKILTRKSGRVL
jgi:hypothetical protein